MNLSMIPSAFDCLRKGETLANPALWKLIGAGASGGIGSAALLSDSIRDFALSANALALGFGYDLHLTEPVARSVGVFVAWTVGMFFTVATTDKLGLLPAKPADGAAGGPPSQQQGPLDPSMGGLAPDAAKAVEVWQRGRAAAAAPSEPRDGPNHNSGTIA